MQMRQLGRTDIQVAPICFGGNVFGWTCDEATSFKVLDAYVEGGGNFIDTADVYSTWLPGHVGGESEAILGRWMTARKNRKHLVIATKVGSRMKTAPDAFGLSRRHIMEGVEASLHRLQTDVIDLYQAHNDDQDTPLDETLYAFNNLVRQGKVRYIGASNYTAPRLTEALHISKQHGYARYECLQPLYNLISSDSYERELEALCREQGLGVITYSSLASGFLSGKYRAGEAIPSGGRSQSVQNRYMNERGFRVLEEVLHVANERNATPTQVALAWILARPGITAPIVSATSVQQTQELLGSVTLQLDEASLNALNKASAWK